MNHDGIERVPAESELRELIAEGQQEVLVEIPVSPEVDTDASYQGYEHGLMQRGYKIISKCREPGMFMYRIGRNE